MKRGQHININDAAERAELQSRIEKLEVLIRDQGMRTMELIANNTNGITNAFVDARKRLNKIEKLHGENYPDHHCYGKPTEPNPTPGDADPGPVELNRGTTVRLGGWDGEFTVTQFARTPLERNGLVMIWLELKRKPE